MFERRNYLNLFTVKRISKSIKGCVCVVAVIFFFHAYTSLSAQTKPAKGGARFGEIADNMSNADMYYAKKTRLDHSHSVENILEEYSKTKRTIKPESSRKNVLFLISDDLRTQLGSYRKPWRDSVTMVTPNLDAMAGRSLLLGRAYVQLSMCGPSRASFLTGRRPDTTKVWAQKGYWRKVGGNFTTIPQYFKEHAYLTAGVGKVFHPRKASGKDDPISWTEPHYHPPNKKYWRKLGVSWRAFSKEELLEMPHPDGMIAEAGIEKLRDLGQRYKESGKNFFLAVGFLKPHLPFAFPEEYLSLYPMKDMKTAENSFVPVDYPEPAFFKPKELLSKSDISQLHFHGELNETLPDRSAKQLRRAYFACVSYIDHLVGNIMKALKELNLEKDTIVSFIGDHGWHLGENGRWGKHTTMEEATQTPMMIHIPGATEKPVQSNSIVEFVDLFPTLVEAAGLPPIRSCPSVSMDISTCSEGISLLPLLKNPDIEIKDGAYSQHMIYKTSGMGYSIRTPRFRYTEWAKVKRNKHGYKRYDYEILWNELVGVELYDHSVDPQENYNVGEQKSYLSHRRKLSETLHKRIGNRITDVQIPFD